MQDVYELILLFQRHRLRPFGQLTRDQSGKVKAYQLFEGLCKGRNRSRASNISDVYAENGIGESNYQEVKSALLKKLLKAVLFFDKALTHQSDQQKAYYECQKQWVLVRYLTSQNANTVAVSLANELLLRAMKYDFTLLCMDISAFLRNQYGLRESNDRRYKEASVHFQYFRSVYDAECTAEELYTGLVMRMANAPCAEREEIHRLATEYYEQCEGLMGTFQSYRLNMYAYMLGLMKYTSIDRHEEAYAFCETAINYFSGLPFLARIPLQVFYYQHLICSIHLRCYAASRKYVRHCLQLMEEGTFNWFKIKEMHLLLLLHTEQHERSAKLLAKVLNHADMAYLPDFIREMWSLFKPYIRYLASLGKIETQLKPVLQSGGHYGGLPVYSKEKSGMQIAILVIRQLQLIKDGRYEQIQIETKMLEEYCNRHLRSRNTRRSYYFMKMLMQIPLAGFDGRMAASRGRRYLEKLEQLPMQLANQTHEIEIIPYDMLWKYALESLQSCLSALPE
ncbi:MAG: hypothetical protein R2791_15815 [Saprospiraceae bacterium]